MSDAHVDLERRVNRPPAPDRLNTPLVTSAMLMSWQVHDEGWFYDSLSPYFFTRQSQRMLRGAHLADRLVSHFYWIPPCNRGNLIEFSAKSARYEHGHRSLLASQLVSALRYSGDLAESVVSDPTLDCITSDWFASELHDYWRIAKS